MTHQERKFTLGEVNTKMGAMGEVRLDGALLDVLGIQPGDFLVFTISTEGVVTVTGEKKAASMKSTPTLQGATGITTSDVTQPALFDAGHPSTKPPRHRRRTT